MVARLVEKAKKQLELLSFSTFQKRHYFLDAKTNFGKLVLNFWFKNIMRKRDDI